MRYLNMEEWDAKSEMVRVAKVDRVRRLTGREEIVAKFEAYLFESDPVGINYESNTDEYRPEAETIALRFLDDAQIDDPGRVVYEEFSRWFGDGETCGPPSRYEAIGRDLWQLWIDSR